MADNIKYRFIQNVGEYFPAGYFGDDFFDKVQKCAGLDSEEVKKLCTPFVSLQHKYDEYKNFIINQNPRVEDAISKTHEFNTDLLKILGYDTSNPYQEHCIVNDDTEPIEIIPVRHIIHNGQQVKMFIMEMQNLIANGDKQPAGLFEQQYESEPDRSTKQQKYSVSQWRFVFPKDIQNYKISPAIINKAVTQIFLLPADRRPHFILMMAGNVVFLFDKDKWARGSYLQFSLDDLFSQARISAFRNYYALFHTLVCKETLAADGEMVLMDSIIEESYKNASEVTKDLKEGVILAVETLANEALYYWRQNGNIPVDDFTDNTFESQVKDDCLTIIYRLLFLFYAESREELEILPLGDQVYKRGYSLESLRDLEMARLNSEESRNGYFFHKSIQHLFHLLSDGHNAVPTEGAKSFSVRPIDSPLFNDSNLHHLANVQIRNIKWQEIIRALSLSRKKNYCGRISYANLGVNQLGSVYESLLAFRGFYAEQDYIEVHKANDPSDGTFLVPYSRMGDFDISSEVRCDPQTGEPLILPKGTFVYRLNGRDRQKSASYYTPEVLTRSTVKYTIKAIIDQVKSGERKATDILQLKILEPAMGAAAFQNEVINQLADAYLTYQQQQQRDRGLKNWRIAPDRYRDELQKVKAYIATHNVYGVDLNPTAIELGKLSLWLNVIHKDMETPFFANRLIVGNAVIGAWLKVYPKNDIYGIKGRGQKLEQNRWWEKSPKKIKFFQNRVNRSINDIYHFLLPDANMLGVRSIKEQRLAHPTEHKRMTDRIKDWTAPISGDDFKILQRLSGKIDYLLKEYYTNQLSIDKYTNNRNDIWDGIDHSDLESIFKKEEQAQSYAKKQKLFDTRYRHDNAYRKLKLAMDYWCALWFWEYDDADSLPTRREYWYDTEALLDVDNDLLDIRIRQALEQDSVSLTLFEGDVRLSENESQIITRTQEQILYGSKPQLSLFAQDEPQRLKIASRLANRYKFFHPMLEFIEVFWQRDGFDIICGNPPWIKLEFDEVGIISEKYPEVAIRKMSAPDVRKKRDELFASDHQLEQLYRDEETENTCSGIFLNAFQNYPLLAGQQTNLYKCVLTNGMELMGTDGYMGLLTPESIYDDPNGQPLRRELYKHLMYHFQYQNELRLFSEVHHHTTYGGQLLRSPRSSPPRFASISNLFHPNTIDACFAHDGHGLCGGIKDENGNWNTKPHKDRIVLVGEEELKVLSDAFENGADWECARFTSIHSEVIVKVLEKLSRFQKHVLNYPRRIISEGLHETNAVDKGIIKRNTAFPEWNNYEMIYSGPHFYVGNPIYKMPRQKCVLNSDYDSIDLPSISDDFNVRSNYTPTIPLNKYKTLIKGFQCGQDEEGNPIYDNWVDYYKVAYRLMTGGGSGERTLTAAILPPKSSHLVTAITTVFDNIQDTTELAGLSASIVLDFFIKVIGCGAIHATRVESFPLGIADKYKSALYSRTLLLNCLTKHYSDLWEEMWRDEYKQETWSISDSRLKPFATLTPQWQWDIPLRNYFERRQALVEIDVIAAMALGLSLQDLEMIYTIQFPVLQQNENDTWYDSEGKIVFTCSKGLTGVGLDRPTWNTIKDQSTGETYTHTIDPAKSELYGGTQQTFAAPYTRCNRIEDYRRAWAHFEAIFMDK